MTKTGFDVSDVKTVRWTVFTSGVTQSKEYGAGGPTHATDDYATGTGTIVKVTEGLGFDVSDVKTVQWTVFTSGVTQSKEYGAGGTTHATDDYATGTEAADGTRYPPFHA